MNTDNIASAATTQEIYDDTTTAPAPGSLVDVCHRHYQTAVEIHANMAWQSQVLKAASTVGARNIDYLTLVARAREILMFGPTYATERDGRRMLFGASLLDEGGFIPLRSERLDGDAS